MTDASVFPLTPRRFRPDSVLSARLQAESATRRVLMTVDAAGGVWRYAMELAHGLRPLGFEVVFVGQGQKPTAAQEAEARARGHLVWIDDPLDWMARQEGELAGLPATLSALVDEWQPDLLHLNNPSQRCDLLVSLPVLTVSHSCVATWWRVVKGGALPPEWQWQFRRQRDGLMQADAVVAPSGSHAELLHRTYGTLPHLHVVPNAISAFLEGATKEETVFAAARWWDEGKNAAVLDRAAASISWPVFMAGPVQGPGGERVDIANAGNADLPYAEVLKRVSRAGIFVSPSLYEPFGLAALEAARAGAALVLSDIPTYRELWSGAAIFFDPCDADDLAAKIEYVAADPLLRADLGNKAIARSRRFTPDVQARTMADIYRDLLDDEQPEAALGELGMNFVFYTHSLKSDWNHGNAHFLRGVLRELLFLGHEVTALEPADGWSRANLIADQGQRAVTRFDRDFPELTSHTYGPGSDHEAAVADADVVVVHEWTDPELVEQLGLIRRRGGTFTLVFHDTHHRAVSRHSDIAGLELEDYDLILAFGETLRERYQQAGWGRRVVTWHEAADIRLFTPMPEAEPEDDLVWIGNWGDGERTAELERFLVEPARELKLTGSVRGVRYPPEALAPLQSAGLFYGGWIANADVPEAFARHRLTLHIPRRPYVESLPGIPTIRVFEALASGIPLICAPWDDSEGLFRKGQDFLTAHDSEEMKFCIRAVLHDPDLLSSLVCSGLETIRNRHTCRHRVQELLDHLHEIDAVPAQHLSPYIYTEAAK